MTVLAILDSLQNYKNFLQKLSVGDYFRWGFLTHLNIRHACDIRNKAFGEGKIRMSFLIQVAIILRKVKIFLIIFLKGMLSKEQLYRIKRKVYRSESDNGVGIYDHPPT